MTHGRYDSCLQIFERKSWDRDFMTFKRKDRMIGEYKEEIPNGLKSSHLF